MAINKAIAKPPKTHGGMRNCIEYVLRDSKIRDGLVYLTGPFNFSEITYDTVYQAFKEEKRIWDKDRGRMCAHNVISWHKDEKLTPEEAFEFGKEFVDRWFEGFQTVMAVHVDREHIHVHMVTNTVNFLDGHKLHSTKKDLEAMKQLTNKMCQEKGLTVAVKGQRFDGTPLPPGHVRTWSKGKYYMLKNQMKESYVARCAMAVLESKESSCSQQEFISSMQQKGWRVIWEPKRKNITFVSDAGERVRDSNITKTFNIEITKEALEHEFITNNAGRMSVRDEAGYDGDEYIDPELAEYYRQVQEACAGTGAGDSAEGDACEVPEERGNETETVARGKDTGSRLAKRERISIRERFDGYKEEAESRRAEQQEMVPQVSRKRGRTR